MGTSRHSRHHRRQFRYSHRATHHSGVRVISSRVVIAAATHGDAHGGLASVVMSRESRLSSRRLPGSLARRAAVDSLPQVPSLSTRILMSPRLAQLPAATMMKPNGISRRADEAARHCLRGIAPANLRYCVAISLVMRETHGMLVGHQLSRAQKRT